MTADEVMGLIKASEKRFYCYELRRPSGEPFYVGIGSARRLLYHELEATWPKRRGHKVSIIRQIWRTGLNVDYRIALFESREAASAEEIRLIALYGRAELRKGTLTNRTDGGEGVPGIIWEFTEARQAGIKRAASLERSPDSRKKMAESAKRRGSDPFIAGARRWREQNMEQLIEERRARWDDDEFRDRHAASMADPHSRALLSQRMRERLDDPEKRKQLADAVSAARSRPVIANGKVFPSATVAGKALGVSRTCVIARANKGIPGYKWVK